MDIHKCANVIEKIRGMSLKRYDVDELHKELEPLKEHIISVPINLGHSENAEAVILRGRRNSDNEKLFKKKSELECRPAKDVDISRANDKHDPVFYGALNFPTVFSELGADKDAIIQMLHIRPKKEVEKLDFSVIGQVDQIERHGSTMVDIFIPYYSHLLYRERLKQTKEEKKISALVDAFFASQFRKRARKPFEYKLCAAICKLYFSSYEMDGVAYPSVENRGGLNFALKESTYKKKCEPTICSACRITDYFGYGKYDWNDYAISRVLKKPGFESYIVILLDQPSDLI